MKRYEDLVYIKQCDCEEIQANHEWEAGDWGYWPENGDINIMYMGEYTPEELGEGHIWLPRQDQLQEMVIPEMNSENMAYYLSTVKNFNDPHRTYKSMEQLWLALVMHELYQKKWDNGWIKE